MKPVEVNKSYHEFVYRIELMKMPSCNDITFLGTMLLHFPSSAYVCFNLNHLLLQALLLARHYELYIL